jgi:uncharacterized protein (TIGR03086 family)
MTTSEQVQPLAAAVDRVVADVPDDALGAPTPCPEFDVRALADHMLGTVEAMRRIGAGEELDPDDPWGTSGDHLTESWRDDLRARLRGFAEAWDDEAAFEGEAMGGTMPKQMIGQMGFAEVLLHGWDLARATGQELSLDTGVLEAARAVMDQIGEMGRSQGAFGELVEVPQHAGDLERVLAEAGRDPAWTSA